MTATEQFEKIGQELGYLETLNKKQRKALRACFDKLTRQQLIAIAVQKEVLPYREARTKTREDLVETLIKIQGVLKPVPA